TLYNELKINLTIPDNNDENLVDSNYNDDDGDFFYELESNSTQVDVEDDDEPISFDRENVQARWGGGSSSLSAVNRK
ncbi:5211_t:CDS:2, partial [Dentiscutata heterogama]